MSDQILKNVFFSIDSNDLSGFVTNIDLPMGVETQDNTTMGDNTRSVNGGLKTWSASITMIQDYAANGPDDVIFPLIGTVVPVVVRPDAGAVGSTNPAYSGNALVKDYTPVTGSVGDEATCKVELVAAKTSGGGTADLGRATS